jgi:O-antigen/teichoic acid export membrane protein
MQSRLTGAISLVAAQAVVLLLGYITHPIIGRVLGPGSYGIFNVVLSIQSIFGILLTLGIPVATARFVAQDEAHAQSILRQGLRWQSVLGVAIAGVVMAGSPLIARLLNDSSLMPYIAFSGLIILSQALYPMYVQYLSGMHRFNKQAALTCLYAVAKLLGALGLMYFVQVYGALGGFAVGGIVAAAAGWWWTRRLGGASAKKLPLKSFFTFAGTYVLILVGLQILISLDLLMVKAILKDNATAGYYSSSVTLARISYMLLQGLGFVLLPSVARLVQPGRSSREAATFISEAIRYLIALVVPAVALAAATSKTLIILFFSREYIPAAPSLTILMIGLGALAFYLLLSNIVAGAGKPQVSMYITGGLIVLSAALGWFLIPTLGLVGAALQTTIAGLVGLAALSAYTFKTFRIRPPIRSTINILIASAVAVSLTYFWEATPLTLFIQYIVIGLLYVAVLILLQEVRPGDRERIATIHPKLKWVAVKK